MPYGEIKVGLASLGPPYGRHQCAALARNGSESVPYRRKYTYRRFVPREAVA